MAGSRPTVPAAGVLLLAAMAAIGVAAAEQPACALEEQSCSEAPQSPKGASLLQRRAEGGRAVLASDTEGSARRARAQERMEAYAWTSAQLAGHHKAYATGELSVSEALRIVSHLRKRGNASMKTSAVAAHRGDCSDTPDWQNWLGYTCQIYADEICENGGARPGYAVFFGAWLGFPEENCCACGKGQEPDCSTYHCGYGWNTRASPWDCASEPGKDCCCEMTCAAYVMDPGCEDGYTPDWDRSSSTIVSDEVCCKMTTTTTTPTPFEGPGKARYVRFLPRAWGSQIGARVSVLVGEDLDEVDPPENRRTYSSVKPLNNQYITEGSEGWPGSNYGRSMRQQCCRHAWTPKVSQVGEWVTVDLERNSDVRGVIVTGKRRYGCPYAWTYDFIKFLTLETATHEDPTTFRPVDNGKVFNTIASQNKGSVTLMFGEPAPAPPPLQGTPVLIKSGHECMSSDADLGWAVSVEDCASKVEARSAAGKFFIYGTGPKLGKCFMEDTASASCPEGWEADQYDFYALESEAAAPSPTPTQGTPPSLVKSGAECGSGDKNMGWSATLQDCADKVHEAGGTFFIYGYGGCKQGKCWMEHTDSASCPEGWVANSYDFYSLADAAAPTPTPAAPAPAPTNEPVLVKSGHECKSGDKNMGDSGSLQECADKVRDAGGSFFIYGWGSKSGKCYMEHTADASCSEGWDSDKYHFYSFDADDDDESHAGTPVLIKEGHECKSAHEELNTADTVQACADQVHEKGGSFFSFSTDPETPGECLMELTSATSCPEGWEAKKFDFYALEAVATPTPSATTPTEVEEICPAQLYTDKIMCNDGTAVEEGECCPDNGFCPSDCLGASSKSIGADGTATCSCKDCSKQRKLEMSDEDAMLKAHNYLRCLHGHPALAWDDAVAGNAELPASQSCDAGDLLHSDSYAMTPRAGENLAMGLASPERAAAAWYNELVDPGYVAGEYGTDVTEAGVGHYTALIWKGATKLGCKSCESDAAGGKVVWACQYADEAPNSPSDVKSEWQENVPQGETLAETPETCCAQIYS